MLLRGRLKLCRATYIYTVFIKGLLTLLTAFWIEDLVVTSTR